MPMTVSNKRPLHLLFIMRCLFLHRTLIAGVFREKQINKSHLFFEKQISMNAALRNMFVRI